MGKSKTPPKSKAQGIREAIEKLQSESREITTAAILSLLPGLGVKDAKATDIYYSTPWKELRDKEKSTTPEPAAEVLGVVAPAPATDGIKKSEAIGQAFDTLGGDAKPKAVIEHVKQTFGMDVSSQLVSNYKATKGKKSLKKRGRPAKAPKDTVAPRAFSGDISLEDIRLVKELAENMGAEKVRQLAEILA